jgi:hypothetical protein
MFKKFGLALAALVVALLAFIQTRADSFAVDRTAYVAAPPALVYGLVADFHQWEGWSPWAKLDPAMKTTYAGSGVGGSYAWEGNDKVGSGKMTFTDLKAPVLVGLTLEFIQPFPATNHTEFRFLPEGEGTRVTWLMTGKNGFLSKAFGLMVSMDQMVGKDFEKGLGAMKGLAEAAAKKAAETQATAAPAEGAPPAPAPEATGKP